MTRFEFGSIASLWSNLAPSKYVPAAQFGKTGIFCPRFDFLFHCIWFSDQPIRRPDGMSAELYRWKLVDDFVKALNIHRSEKFIPGNFICTDESISCWHGGGGYWINEDIPCYMAIDRKLDNGSEIQNSACGESGVMSQLKIVKKSTRK